MNRVASAIGLSLFLASCGSPPAPAEPTIPPKGEVAETESSSASESASASEDAKAADGHAIYLGWFCPDAGHGRPGIRPLFARAGAWSADAEELARMLMAQEAKRFSVWSWAGGRAGSFAVAAAAKDAQGALAIGGYMGQSTCVLSEGASVNEQAPDAACVELSGACSIATAELEASSGFQARPYEELPDLAELRRSGACVSEDVLWVDVDGDERKEGFELDQLLASGAPPAELPLASSAGDHCEASFAMSLSESAALQLIAVIDADRDGRFELVFRRGSGEFLIYGAPDSPSRMELQAATSGFKD